MGLEVLYTAAHADWPDSEPLGGGKAVADWLVASWAREQPFPLTVLSPRRLGLVAGSDHPPPRGNAALPRSLAHMGEREYARFCRQFERATTAAILEHDPRACVVLTNDISEGPDFARLGARGYRLVTIFHVDVVEYFTRFYLRNLMPPHWLTRWGRLGWLPDLAQLVFTKQHDAVRHSTRLVVPSAPMRRVLRRCYPWCPAERITVLPWGNVADGQTPVSAGSAPSRQRPEAGAPCADVAAEDEFVILTLSRLSPEKGIDRLLKALAILDSKGFASTAPKDDRGSAGASPSQHPPDLRPREGEAPAEPRVRLIIGGAPAYMKGKRYAANLRRWAGRLRRIRVDFAGHVTGAEKSALLQRADLFVSPSRHESYGLAIAEAQAAGCRVLSHPHYGAQGRAVDCGNRRELARALVEEISAGRTLNKARTPPATVLPAESAARRLAAVLQAAGYRGQAVASDGRMW